MPLSADDKLLLEHIENDFVPQVTRSGQTERYYALRETAKGLAKQIVHTCPDSNERSLALSKLEETVMWAHAAIARMPE